MLNTHPQELHDSHKDIPFLPEHFTPRNSKNEKLCATLLNKKSYVIHYRALKQAIDHGLKITKIHRILKFKQSAWLKPYIDLNTYQREQALTKFEQDLFKFY